MAVEAAAGIAPETGPPSSLAAFWAAFRENRGAVVGLAVFCAIVLLAIFADLVAPYSPYVQFREAVKLPPLWEHGGQASFPLGTDALGRDMLSRLVYGARISLFIGSSVMLVSLAIGIQLGLAAAFAKGWIDTAIMRTMRSEEHTS